YYSNKAQTQDAELIRQAKVILWDEAPMQHRHVAEVVERSLRDLRKDDRPFGGLVVIFAGDFRQCPPVVPKGSRSQIVDACINNASFWSKVTTLPLTINMRLLRNGANMTPEERNEAEQFAAWLLRVGDGLTDGDEAGYLRLPQEYCIDPDS